MKLFISSTFLSISILASAAIAAPVETKVFIEGETQWGENLFIRGGIDWDYAATYLGRDCSSDPFLCAIPITHQINGEDPNRAYDTYLDWYGAEVGQGTNVAGSPAVWTTNDCSHATVVFDEDLGSSCNPNATVAGYGYTAQNQWGPHYWLLDVSMECDATADSWFELKTYIQNGAGWESDVSDVEAQWTSGNHFARCGYTNVFRRDSGEVIFREALENQPPVIIIDYPDTVVGGGEVVLDASRSYDPDGDDLFFLWNDGTEGPINVVTFLETGVFTFSLQVSDSAGNISDETIIITVIEAPEEDWQRTVILIYGETNPTQQLTLLGGLDHDFVLAQTGEACTAENKRCAIPIRHRVRSDDPARENDNYLDWYGAEENQGNVNGTPLSWTTNNCANANYVVADDADSSCNSGAQESGYGYSHLNSYGDHYWLLDVDMDCNKTIEGWFEVKSFISNGAGWEGNINQAEFGGLIAPEFASINHVARCGMANVFQRNVNEAVEFLPVQGSEAIDAVAYQLEIQFTLLLDGWVQDAVNQSNALLQDPLWENSDRAAFFEHFFARYPLTDNLRNYLVYPLMYWFDEDFHSSMQSTLGPVLAARFGDYLGNDIAALNTKMNSDQDFRESVYSALHLVQEIMNFGVLTDSEKNALDSQVLQSIQQLPGAWDTNITYNTATEARLAMLRVHVLGYLNEALILTPERKQTIQSIANYQGIYADIWDDHLMMVHDNHSMTEDQLNIILSLLEIIPTPLANPRNMTVNEYLADDSSMLRSIPWISAVNIAGLLPGTITENGFPSDVDPVLADVFTLVAAHEFNHVVDYHTVRHIPELEARKTLLIEKAGDEPTHYLRSMIEPGFFTQHPQEFLASISNQWFTDTRHTFEIARVRALDGNVQPLNQFILMAEIYSMGGDAMAGYTMNTSGEFTYTLYPVTRDADGRINSVEFDDGIFSFEFNTTTEDYTLLVP